MSTYRRNGQQMTDADAWKEGNGRCGETEGIKEGFEPHHKTTSVFSGEHLEFLARCKAEKESER